MGFGMLRVCLLFGEQRQGWMLHMQRCRVDVAQVSNDDFLRALRSCCLHHATMAYEWRVFAISAMRLRFTADRVDGCFKSESLLIQRFSFLHAPVFRK